MRQLVIIGAGGYGREVYAWATQSAAFERDWVIKGFLDDNLNAVANFRTAGRVIARIADYTPAPEDVFVCAIGTPAFKKRCCQLLESRGGEFVSIIHRSAVLALEVEIGAGVVLCPGAVVSANARLGKGVGVNLQATVDHDALVGDWSQINCHCDVTGGAVLEDEVFLGSHSTILPGVRVGRGSVVGAGAVVNRDVAPGTTVVGVPARPL